MINPFDRIETEEGSVIVLTLMVLVVLSIIGFSASRTSMTEMQIVRNDGTYQQNFYLAESGAIQGAQMLSNENATWVLRRQRQPWLNRDQDLDLRTDLSNWDASGGATTTANVSNITADGAIEFSVVDLGVAPGSSMGMSGSQLHEFAAMGVGNRNERGQIVIELGFRKRY